MTLLRVLLLCLLPGSVIAQAANLAPVDFASDILPLLKTRCWECHDRREAKGNLRLDAERFAKRHGRLGLMVIGPTREESELYQRLISPDEAYRMPRGHDPLPSAEVELIGQWIDQGAVWPQTARPDELKRSRSTKTLANRLIRRGEQLFSRAPWWTAGGIIVSLSAIVLLCLRWRDANSDGRPPRIRISWLIIAALLFALGGLRQYYQQSLAEFSPSTPDFTAAAPPWQPDIPDYRLAARTMHPRRLGGRYYRGNDERDPLLYNGGFYLTATIDLSLQDDRGSRLEAGSTVGSNLFVEILVTKAPGATPRLFSKGIMDQVFVTPEWIPEWQPTSLEMDPILLDLVTPGEQWRARIPVAQTDGGKIIGNIYIYKGDRDGLRISKANRQYGIHYQLSVQEGIIQPESELWMGSMSRHPYIQYVPPEKIPATEWFDFRPMPVITGTNSTDPRLLGIGPHQPQK